MKKRSARWISRLLVFTALLNFSACADTDAPAADETGDDTVSAALSSVLTETAAEAEGSSETVSGTEEPAETTEAEKQAPDLSLDGKKVMFIGNSMLYYGNCVIQGDQTAPDQGYFYQLCKANGENVTVTDCTYGSHGLSEFISVCNPDHHSADHLAQYPLDEYDYVIMCQVTSVNGLLHTIQKIMKRFPNPKTKFIYLCAPYSYQQHHAGMIQQFSEVQKAGITVVNVGELVYNIWTGQTAVPGAKLTYNKESFIVNKKDTAHPNMLTGYLEALMVYCAITGRSAVGQPHLFASNASLNSKFSTASFLSSYYVKGTTNFDKILHSTLDIRGLQTLADEINQKWGAAGIPQD